MAGADKLGKAHVLFKVTEIDCAACHGDAHGGRFTTTAAMKKNYPAACADCHNAKKFRPSTYDEFAHARSGFPLEGAHRAVPCVGCHNEIKQPVLASSLVGAKFGTTMAFTQKRNGCVACHDNPHGTQFAKRKDKGACDGCHGSDTFTPATRFNHDKDSSFPLAGAHAKVPCLDCHIPPRGVPKAALVYKGLSGKCESCHAQPVRQ
jgi:predicted CXXCH cytochrome family protein